MSGPVYLYRPQVLRADEKQILRYMGCRGEATPEVFRLAVQAAQETIEAARPACCFLRLPVQVDQKEIDFGFMKVRSRNLYQNLQDCREVYWIGATIGVEQDRLIRRWERTSPARALALSAAGSAAVEDLCGTLTEYLREQTAEEGLFLRPRFSAGYGDFALEAQREIVKVLDMGRKIGVTMTDSLMLTPSKSVTALIGISSRPTRCLYKGEGCSRCEAAQCPYRA